MAGYIVRRTGLTVLIVLGAMVVLFTLIQLVPVNILEVLLGPFATPEMIAKSRENMGLDRPVLVQLGRFLYGILRGDLGTCVLSQRPVSSIVFHNIPYTVILAFSSMFLGSIVGIPLGMFSAAHQNSFLDKILAVFSIAFISMPSFLLAILSILVFSLLLGWFPMSGAGDPGNIIDQLRHLILPAGALAIQWVGYLARLMRATTLEELTKDYIRTARAKGLSERVTVYKHALRSSLIPVISVIGVGFGTLLGGQVLIEVIFHRPGIGNVIYHAIENRNFPVVEGGLIVTVFLYATINMLVDFSHAFIDPRIRYD